jgi:hypothetical protein
MGNPEGNKEREGFADAINRAAFGNERVLLRRRGRAVAAVVPIEDLRLLEALEIVSISSMPAQRWPRQTRTAPNHLMLF